MRHDVVRYVKSSGDFNAFRWLCSLTFLEFHTNMIVKVVAALVLLPLNSALVPLSADIPSPHPGY